MCNKIILLKNYGYLSYFHIQSKAQKNGTQRRYEITRVQWGYCRVEGREGAREGETN
jgi:hypothetical protein